MTNVYRIGVSLAMSSNSSQVLGVLSRELLGVHAKVKDLQGGFGRLKLAIGGAMAIGAGFAILGSLKAPLDEARKFEMAVTKFGNFGLGPERTREAAEFAKQMKITGSTYVENMKHMAEAQGVFRESGLSGDAALRGAKLAAPILAKIDFANSALDDESKAKMHTAALAMLRFIEMRGGVRSPEEFNRIADMGFKAIQSSGGNINWEQLRQFMARGGVAAQGIRDEVLFGKLEPVIGELKGSTAGNALMTAFNRLQGIVRLPNQVAHTLAANGIWDPSKIVWNSMGGIKSFKGNPLRDSALLAADPVAFYQKNILPMYAKMGLDQTGRNRENALLFGRTGGSFFSLIDRQQAAIANSVDAQRKALGINAAYGAAGGTLNGKIIDLQAKYTNLLERLGEAVLPLAVKGLNALIPVITKLTDWMAANPGKMKLIAEGIVVLGAALIGLGVAAVGMAIFAGGWVAVAVAGVGALVGSVAALVVMNWDKVKAAGAAVMDFIKRILDGAAHILGFKQANADIPKGAPGTVPLKKGQWYWDPFSGWAAAANAPGGGAAWDAYRPHNSQPSAAPSGPMHAQKQSFTGDVHIDGRKVGKVVWRHMNGDLARSAQSSGSDFDPTLSLAPVRAG